jgi:hypothetical protein
VIMNYNLDQLLQVCQEHNLADDKTLRLFACYCARSVLHHITDQKSRDICQNTIEVVEKFAHGLVTKEELEATYSATGSAANSAAYYTAYYAAHSAAHFASHSTAYYAAYYAAHFASHSTTYSAAKQQYVLHLLEMVPRLKRMLAFL